MNNVEIVNESKESIEGLSGVKIRQQREQRTEEQRNWTMKRWEERKGGGWGEEREIEPPWAVWIQVCLQL